MLVVTCISVWVQSLGRFAGIAVDGSWLRPGGHGNPALRATVAVVAGALWLWPAGLAAQIPGSSVVVYLEEITAGLGGSLHVAPTDLVPLGDGSGRMAVATINGVVRLLDGGGGYLDSASTPFLDTRGEAQRFIPGNYPFGMTGVAFHPDYHALGAAGYGKFFTILTETPHGTNPQDADFLSGQTASVGAHQDVLVEWTSSDPASDQPVFSRRDVLRFDQPHENHNVTDLAFGSDGLLYLAAGDGGSGFRKTVAQQSDNYLGSVFRLDPLDPDAPGTRSVTHTGGWINKGRFSSSDPSEPLYRVPAGEGGNPGAGISGELDEIYAMGFRSPYRLTFDRLTGELYVGDVGEGRREEVSRVVSNGNYGWGRFEGSLLHDSSISLENGDPHAGPLFEYDRTEGETVIGGFVYRGTALPELQGKYLFADFGRQVTPGQAPTPARLFAGDTATGQIEELQIDFVGEALIERNISGVPISRQFIMSIGEDELGELYLVVGDDPQFPRALQPDGRILRVWPGITNGVLGDVNQDGVVSGDGRGAPGGDDVAAFVLGWKSTGHASLLEQVLHGDLNVDGTTDLLDWHILRSSHPQGATLDLGALLVPEPGWPCGALWVGVWVMRRRAARGVRGAA